MSERQNHTAPTFSRSTESDIDETITVIVVALTKGLAVLLWWSVLFPMISIPILASVWVGFRDGPVFGVLLAAVSGSGFGGLVATLARIVPAVGDRSGSGAGGGHGGSTGTVGPRSARCTA